MEKEIKVIITSEQDRHISTLTINPLQFIINWSLTNLQIKDLIEKCYFTKQGKKYKVTLDDSNLIKKETIKYLEKSLLQIKKDIEELKKL